MSGILVVEDNAMNSKLVDFVLTAAGFTVRIAPDAASAMSAIEQSRPELILMDLQLPGVDGFELTRHLKMNPQTRGIVIVALSAYAMKGDRERALEAGCDDYLAKPFDTRALPKQLAEFLARGPR